MSDIPPKRPKDPVPDDSVPDNSVSVRRISGLGDLIAAAQHRGDAPVDSWNPPYCGDIGMKIRADGQWIYAGSPIHRSRLVKLFARILRRDADGRHYLVTPVEKVDVEVADAPFLAVELDVSGQGRNQVLTFRTNVDDVVKIDSEHPLSFKVEEATGGLKPYVRVRGRLEALVTRALYYDLVELAQVDGNSPTTPSIEESAQSDLNLGIWSGGTWFPLKTDNSDNA